MDKTDHIATEFKASELVLVAEALGLSPTSDWGSRRLVDAIRIRLKKIGVPEDDPEDERKADLLDDFLYMDHWIDDDGNITVEQEVYPETVEEFLKLYEEKSGKKLSKPDCYGYADDEDPACKRCLLYIYCAEERIAALPPCYGVMYNSNDEECRACMEAYYCKYS
ncbi:MAG: hypothetical protein ACXABD_20470 [Candidatus Thorarchaeota archaeon]|jgi:hypothetical protein